MYVKLTEEEIDDLASWYAFSVIFSKKGADIVQGVRRAASKSKTTARGKKIYDEPSFFPSLVASELIQYVAFVASGGGGDGTITNFVEWMVGRGGEVERDQPEAKNLGGLIAPVANTRSLAKFRAQGGLIAI